MKQFSGKPIIDEILDDAAEQREIVRITVSLSKDVFDRFKDRCGSVPVSRALDKLLRRLLAEEAA
jgi:hypothetical protein